VRDACQLAEDLGVRNLVLYHTEDKNLANRKRLYTAEGKQYFAGNLFVPDDLERIEIS
jgi:ribonuclease Z